MSHNQTVSVLRQICLSFDMSEERKCLNKAKVMSQKNPVFLHLFCLVQTGWVGGGGGGMALVFFPF